MPKLSYIYPVHMCIFNFFEVQNVPPKNKRNFHVNIFVKSEVMAGNLRIMRIFQQAWRAV